MPSEERRQSGRGERRTKKSPWWLLWKASMTVTANLTGNHSWYRENEKGHWFSSGYCSAARYQNLLRPKPTSPSRKMDATQGTTQFIKPVAHLHNVRIVWFWKNIVKGDRSKFVCTLFKEGLDLHIEGGFEIKRALRCRPKPNSEERCGSHILVEIPLILFERSSGESHMTEVFLAWPAQIL